MLLQHLRALCLASGGPGSVWNYLGALVRLTGVSGRFACGLRTVLHFTNAKCVEVRRLAVALFSFSFVLWVRSIFCGFLLSAGT
jgi:hypothetical protein